MKTVKQIKQILQEGRVKVEEMSRSGLFCAIKKDAYVRVINALDEQINEKLKSGPCKGGIKNPPTTEKPNIQPTGQKPVKENARIKQLEKELKENAGYMYNVAILATPSGEMRNKLTVLNIRRLQILMNEFFDMEGTGDIYDDLMSTPDAIVAGEEEIIISRQAIELDILGQMFLRVEDLAQRGSDMEGHELALKLCMLIHPELY